ncbi:MAG: hypothetical protein HY909_12245 [Deltaproteobacteria bacterium]|nr:hypothetical protein [Deltaproteobacteria bacterium]
MPDLTKSLAAACVLALQLAPREAVAGPLSLFLEGELGGSYSNVIAFTNTMLLPGVSVPGATETKLVGSRFGAFAGVFVGPVGFGLHGALSRFSPYDIGTLGPELRVRLPTPLVQPYARLQGGYAWLGAVNAQQVWRCMPTSTSTQCPSVAGWYLGAGLGIDFLLGRYISVGGDLGLDILNFSRSASPTTVDYTMEGSSVGLQATLAAHATLRL